jgi:hypothetical protein
VAGESGDLFSEASRVWRSFWMMIGHLHQPVWGPSALYVWGGVLLGLGALGTASGRRRPRMATPDALMLAAAALTPLALLIYGTLSVDISYGRLLFPGLVGLAPLLAWGWTRLLGRFAALPLIPLALLAVFAPPLALADAYPRAEPVAAFPADAVPVNVSAGGLQIVAYTPPTSEIAPGGEARAWLYLSGAHSDNPALFATLLDPLTNEARGLAAVYPGLAPTDALAAGTLYRVPLRIGVDLADAPLSPRLLRLQLGWQTMLETAYLPMTDAAGVPVEALVLDGPPLRDPAYAPPAPKTAFVVTFHDPASDAAIIRLRGYTLDAPEIAPGQPLALTLSWEVLGAPADASGGDTAAAVQLIEAAAGGAELIAQDDGPLTGYPSRAWRAGAVLADSRALPVESCEPGATYRLAVGWYRQTADGQFTHLRASAPGLDGGPLVALPADIACGR